MSQTPHSEVFAIYAMSVALMVINLFFLAFVTAIGRGKNKAFLNPEDAGYQESTSQNEWVARVMRAHRNAVENILPFVAIGLLYVMTVGSPLGAKLYFGVFVTARWLHSFVYLAGKQPWRTMFFAAGALATLGMTVQVLIFGAGALMR
jgi:glutathione S-transferase